MTEESKKKDLGEVQSNGDFVIQPENIIPELDTTKWPILLKNYDKLNVRTGHYTPLPEAGHTPLKRPLKVTTRPINKIL